ncbi:MAG: cell division topological specificity factor MinE, partial [Cutibacterium granulosum]|nr:cell division topological specificity factor MinE [Cutibacterium granulosum]
YKVAEGNKRVRELQERIVALETQLDTEMAKAFEGSHARTVTDAGVPTAGDIWTASNDSTIVDLSRVAFPNPDEDDVAERRQA